MGRWKHCCSFWAFLRTAQDQEVGLSKHSQDADLDPNTAGGSNRYFMFQNLLCRHCYRCASLAECHETARCPPFTVPPHTRHMQARMPEDTLTCSCLGVRSLCARLPKQQRISCTSTAHLRAEPRCPYAGMGKTVGKEYVTPEGMRLSHTHPRGAVKSFISMCAEHLGSH